MRLYIIELKYALQADLCKGNRCLKDETDDCIDTIHEYCKMGNLNVHDKLGKHCCSALCPNLVSNHIRLHSALLLCIVTGRWL